MKKNDTPWRGYDYDEIVMLQAVNLARRHVTRERIQDIVGAWRHPFRPLPPDDRLPAVGMGRQLMHAVIHSLDRVDYVIMALGVIKRLKRLLSKRKKKPSQAK